MNLIKIFKALSDRTRLRLFYILQQYELNVNEIVQVVDMIQSGVSRHLKILSESRLLTARKEGSFTYYSVLENDEIRPLLKIVRQFCESETKSKADLIKAGQMIENRQLRTKRFFKAVALQWDRLKKEVLGDLDLDSRIMEKTVQKGRISDLGCGTGEMLQKMYSDRFEEMIGIDSSPEMIEQAKSKLKGLSGIQLRLGELEHLPMKDKEIDTAVMNMVLRHINQPQLAVEEVFRVLKPGGMFILSDFEKHDNEKIKDLVGGQWLGFKKNQIKFWLEQSGFKLIQTASYPVKHRLKINIFEAQKQNFEERT